MDFTTKLILWYQNNKRDFPWRNTTNPYYIWLSEIILQQTRTEQGLPYYIAFTKKYETIKDLANDNEENILKLWQGLGYYSRARNLHFTAQHIVTNLKSVFPDSYADLLKLKGIGDYTASAIASICYDEKCAVVDGNVYRVLARYFGIDIPTNTNIGIKTFKDLAQKLLPNEHIGNYNQAIMDFGASICTPKANCNACFLNDSCYALQHNVVNKLPQKKPKIKLRKRFFNYLVILSKGNNISLLKRTTKDIWLNLFEFPLIETDKLITKEMLMEHNNFKAYFKKNSIKSIILYNENPIIHKLSHQHIITQFWIIDYPLHITDAIPLKKLKNYPVSTLIYNFIKEFDY